MDLDRDGRLDVVSGSYPGELYVFPGLPDGTFGAAQKIQDAEGKTINVGNAAALYVADWDADGDLDLVVGDIQGHVWFLANESGSGDLAFGSGVKLKAGDAAIRVPSGDAGPVLADWDGNGTMDLVVGCGDGSVKLFANRAAEGPPDLEEPVDLLPSGGGMSLRAGEAVRCGARAKPCVVDFDDDGALDLLVGDVLMDAPREDARDPGAQAAFERLQARQRWILDRYTPAMERVTRRVLERFGAWEEGLALREAWDRLTDEQREQYGAAHAEAVKRDLEAGALQRMLQDVSRAMATYRSRPAIHGHVWWLRRLPPEETLVEQG